MANIILLQSGKYAIEGTQFDTRLQAEDASKVIDFIRAVRSGVTLVGKGFAELTTAAQIYKDLEYYPTGAQELSDTVTGLAGARSTDVHEGIQTLTDLMSPANAELYTDLLKLVSKLRNL